MCKKIYVIGPQLGYARWVEDAELTRDMSEADIVFLTGGADINPAIYGRPKHESTYFNDERDKFEIAEYNKAIELKVPLIISTCRGLQLCAALNGGILIQDVTNHWVSHTHGMTNGEETYEITSLHHQMVYPYTMPKGKYEILFWSSPPRSRHYEGITEEEMEQMYVEPEVMLIKPNKTTKILGIQGHPEMMYSESPTIKMLNNLVEKLLKND